MLKEGSSPIKVVFYIRVSTEEQAEHGFSIDAQIETLTNYCKTHGKTIHKIYCERGVSGKSIKGRFELQKLLSDAKEGLFDEVLVWRISRMARKTIDLLHIVEHLSKFNVAFRSYSENFETATPMGKFALQMMGAVGELERNTIVENVKLGLNQRARMGKHNAKAPLGYRVVTVSETARNRETKIEILLDEAKIIKRIFEEFAIGRGLKAIANSLNHDKYTTKKGNHFSTCAVKDILDNPFYIGNIRYKRYENWSEKRRKGKSADPIYSDGVHPAIITEELWDKVHYLKTQKSKVSMKRFSGDYLLTGLIRCPQCGGAMTASRTNNKSKDGTLVIRMYYSCGNFRSKGSSVCSANSVRKVDAESYVFDRLKQVLTKPQILTGIVQSINDRKIKRIKPLQEELARLLSQIEEVQTKKQRYMELYENDKFDTKLFSDRLIELERDLDHFHAKRSEIEFQLNDDNSQTVTYDQVRSSIANFELLLSASSAHQKKALLHLIIQKITVDKNRQIDKIEMIFDEMSEKHFLNLAPSAESLAEGAFSFKGKAPKLKSKLIVTI